MSGVGRRSSFRWCNNWQVPPPSVSVFGLRSRPVLPFVLCLTRSTVPSTSRCYIDRLPTRYTHEWMKGRRDGRKNGLTDRRAHMNEAASAGTGRNSVVFFALVAPARRDVPGIGRRVLRADGLVATARRRLVDLGAAQRLDLPLRGQKYPRCSGARRRADRQVGGQTGRLAGGLRYVIVGAVVAHGLSFTVLSRRGRSLLILRTPREVRVERTKECVVGERHAMFAVFINGLGGRRYYRCRC